MWRMGDRIYIPDFEWRTVQYHRGNLRISIAIFQDDYTVVAKNAIKKSALCEYFTYQPLVQDI